MSSAVDKQNIDEQIRKAKQRAEDFHKSLTRARTQEQEVIENFEREKLNLDNERSILEKERLKWAKSLEEKNLVVQQLERELAATLDISVSRSTDKYLNIDGLDIGGNISDVKSIPMIKSNDTKDLRRTSFELKSLKEEVELLRAYRIDAEGKLQFRLEQV